MKRIKGQVFIAGAAVLIVMLSLFRTSFIDVGVESPTFDLLLDNIEREYRHTAVLSAEADDDLLDDLSNWLRDKRDDFQSLYMFVQSDNGQFDLTVGNYLRGTILIDITGTGFAPTISSTPIPDKSSQTFTFSGTGTATVNLEYTLGTTMFKESITFDISKQFVTFYDLGLNLPDGNVRRKDVIRT